jgi:apolipoprotein N-acyltransferase
MQNHALPSYGTLPEWCGNTQTGYDVNACHYLVHKTLVSWLPPVVVMIIPASLSIYAGFGLALARLIWSRGSIRIVSLAVPPTFAEWLRGHLVTDFPWNTFG